MYLFISVFVSLAESITRRIVGKMWPVGCCKVREDMMIQSGV